MSTLTVPHRIDAADLPFPASVRGNDADGYTVEADVPEADLRAAVDATPAWQERPDRIAVLEAKVAAAEALAEKANATAQEVAAAMRDAAPGRQ